MTIGAWNVRRLPIIIDHLVDIGVVSARHNYQNFFINLLQYPAHYHVSVLPDSYRQETINELRSWIVKHNEKYNTTVDHAFTHIIHELEKPFDLQAAKKFVWNTESIDGIRNEDLFKVIPEMTVVKDAVNSA